MAMDQMIQNRNMPQQGMQNVFDPTTNTFVNIPFQTDPNFKGRRTVMTRTGPQALPGFQGQENPYRALGRGVRNLLGNLFDRGSLRREERKREQTIEEASQDPQRSASRERVFDTMLDTMYPSVVERPEFDPAVTNQARIDELQERINRPIMRGPAPLPTFDVSQVRTPSTSETARKTTTFADGSALMIDTKGNARLLTKEGKEISQNDPKYAETLAKSIEQGIIQEGRLVFQKEEAKNRAKQLQSYAKSIPQAQRLVDNYEEVLKTIDEGAETGFIMSKLPSLRAASQRLDALQQELGLNVIANTTFGALSESELNFALRTALPTNLNPDELKIEIQRRLEIQNKLIAYMMEAQKFIRDGGTVNGFLELKYDEQKAREKAQQNGGATTPSSSDEDEEYEIRTPEGEILR
tara:strand:+ start:1230 stop:2459 length:1230 start_codon:yes stop_codon:yes gene_type:complete